MQLAVSGRDSQPAEQPNEQRQRRGSRAQAETLCGLTTTIQPNEGTPLGACTGTSFVAKCIVSARSDARPGSVLSDYYAKQNRRIAHHGAYAAVAGWAAVDTASNFNSEARETDDDSRLPVRQHTQQQQQLDSLDRTATAHSTTAHSLHSPITMPHSIGRWRLCWHCSQYERAALSFIYPLLLLLLLLLLPLGAHAGCRQEPSRACEAICTPDGKNCTLRALLLLPDDDMYLASMRRTLPVLYLAEQTLRARQVLPAHLRFEWMAEDVQCDAAYAVIKAMDGIVKNCAHVVFGPVCDYALAAVSRITKYFSSNGTPLISVGGATYDFEKKKTSCADEFYMLIRTGMLSFESMSELTIALMRRYNWSHSIFFYERDGQNNVAGQHTCFLMMNSLGKQMRKEHMIFAQFPIDPSVTNRTIEMKREIGNKHAKSTPADLQCTPCPIACPTSSNHISGMTRYFYIKLTLQQ